VARRPNKSWKNELPCKVDCVDIMAWTVTNQKKNYEKKIGGEKEGVDPSELQGGEKERCKTE